MSPRIKRISAVLRRRIEKTAHYRCAYCKTSQRVVGPLLEIDHIIPESRGGTSDEGNLVLACPMCNSHKADRQDAIDSESGNTVLLFNPKTDRWNEHFVRIDQGAIIRGQTPIGRATVVALEMNHPDTVAARRLWVIVGWHPPKDE